MDLNNKIKDLQEQRVKGQAMQAQLQGQIQEVSIRLNQLDGAIFALQEMVEEPKKAPDKPKKKG